VRVRTGGTCDDASMFVAGELLIGVEGGEFFGVELFHMRSRGTRARRRQVAMVVSEAVTNRLRLMSSVSVRSTTWTGNGRRVIHGRPRVGLQVVARRTGVPIRVLAPGCSRADEKMGLLIAHQIHVVQWGQA
jgi:hypothetical protein